MSTTDVHAAITLLATTQSVTTSITNPSTARALSITGTGATLTGTVTLTGTDEYGQTQTESFALSGASTRYGHKAFATVTSIALPAYVVNGDTVSVGTADRLFDVPEAKTFDKEQLATVSAADIEACEQRIRQEFEEICGVPFIPQTRKVWLDGNSSTRIYIPEWYAFPRYVSAVTVTDTDGTEDVFDATEIADLRTYPETGEVIREDQGVWSTGYRNVAMTFTHGYRACPEAIRRAALILAVYQLTPTDMSDRLTYMSDGSMTYTLATAGRGQNSWYGIPAVDSVLARYNRSIPGVA